MGSTDGLELKIDNWIKVIIILNIVINVGDMLPEFTIVCINQLLTEY